MRSSTPPAGPRAVTVGEVRVLREDPLEPAVEHPAPSSAHGSTSWRERERTLPDLVAYPQVFVKWSTELRVVPSGITVT
jgi:hypothetical protein